MEIWDDALALERGWVARYPHPDVGVLGQVGVACSFSDTPVRAQGRPFIVGEHTRSVLTDLGYPDDEIAALMEARAVGDESIDPTRAPDGAAVAKSPWEPE